MYMAISPYNLKDFIISITNGIEENIIYLRMAYNVSRAKN